MSGFFFRYIDYIFFIWCFLPIVVFRNASLLNSFISFHLLTFGSNIRFFRNIYLVHSHTLIVVAILFLIIILFWNLFISNLPVYLIIFVFSLITILVNWSIWGFYFRLILFFFLLVFFMFLLYFFLSIFSTIIILWHF